MTAVLGAAPAILAATRPTVPDLITFIVSAVIILAGAIGVVTSRNPVHAALSLVMTLFGVAVLFIEEQADFLAAVQVIVYAGAIVVLFLFVIMFLGVDRNEDVEMEPLRGQRPLAFLLVVVAVAGVMVLGVHSHWATGAHHVSGPPGSPAQNTADLGRSIFTTYLYAFEVTAGLLLIAVIGAVVLARRPPPGSGDEDDDDGLTSAGAGAGAGGLGAGPVGAAGAGELGAGAAGGPGADAGADDQPGPDAGVPEEVAR